MKIIISLMLLAAASLAPAQEIGEPTPNLERVDLQAYRESYAQALKKPAEGGKEAVTITRFELAGLPERFQESWEVSADGTTYRVRYEDPETQGAAVLQVRTKPFEARLALAPSLRKSHGSGESKMDVWQGQVWDTMTIPYLGGQVRCFTDEAADGDQPEIRSTEPFTVNPGEGKAVWIWISAEYGSGGMTLEAALRAFRMAK
ncbi:MAG: hypothetical protein ACQKBY_08735 [Verrucomicrobiales bacterium]